MNHDLEAGESSEIKGVGGERKSYKNKMRSEILVYCTEETLISFLPTLHQPLIGVRSFLSNFCLTIDYPNEIFSLKHSERKENEFKKWGTV